MALFWILAKLPAQLLDLQTKVCRERVPGCSIRAPWRATKVALLRSGEPELQFPALARASIKFLEPGTRALVESTGCCRVAKMVRLPLALGHPFAASSIPWLNLFMHNHRKHLPTYSSLALTGKARLWDLGRRKSVRCFLPSAGVSLSSAVTYSSYAVTLCFLMLARTPVTGN